MEMKNIKFNFNEYFCKKKYLFIYLYSILFKKHLNFILNNNN